MFMIYMFKYEFFFLRKQGRLEDSGKYLCWVNNTAGEETIQVTLTVTGNNCFIDINRLKDYCLIDLTEKHFLRGVNHYQETVHKNSVL